MIRLWSKRKFERVVEFLTIVPVICSDFENDFIYQLRDKNSNCGDSTLAKVNNFWSYGTQCCRYKSVEHVRISGFVIKIKQNLLGLCHPENTLCIVKMHTFQGDLTDESAETKALVWTGNLLRVVRPIF